MSAGQLMPEGAAEAIAAEEVAQTERLVQLVKRLENMPKPAPGCGWFITYDDETSEPCS